MKKPKFRKFKFIVNKKTGLGAGWFGKGVPNGWEVISEYNVIIKKRKTNDRA